jgi:hypothetical protein
MAKKNHTSFDTEECSRMTVALLACLVRDIKESAGQIQIMDAFGVSSPTIAKALDLSPISVRTALHRKRHARKR